MYIGVDLGGTNIAVGLVDEDGKILYKSSVPTKAERDPEAIMDDIAAEVMSVLAEQKVHLNDILWVGIGSPGSVDTEKGVVVCAHNLPFAEYPICDALQKRLRVPVYLGNDANCAALGESVAGATRGYADSIVVTLGTGVGGGIILNHKIHKGYNGGAGEVGHMILHVDGEPCSCGQRGCFEAYSSATALVRMTREAIAAHPESRLKEFSAGGTRINGKTAFLAAREGDETAQEVVDRYIHFLAIGIVNLINLFQPRVVAIGGGVSHEGENLLLPLRKEVEERAFKTKGGFTTRIELAQLGNDAGIIGAAFLGKDR